MLLFSLACEENRFGSSLLVTVLPLVFLALNLSRAGFVPSDRVRTPGRTGRLKINEVTSHRIYAAVRETKLFIFQMVKEVIMAVDRDGGCNLKPAQWARLRGGVGGWEMNSSGGVEIGAQIVWVRGHSV